MRGCFGAPSLMTPSDFLRAVWPGNGIYCLATPFTPPGQVKPLYAHKTFATIDAAADFVMRERAGKEIFFTVHALKEESVWNPQKVDWKTGELGAKEIRTRGNMRAVKCFFLDLDVGKSASKYPTQREAALDLQRFCKAVEFPIPLVTSSGGGLHVYWRLTEPLDSQEWLPHAVKLKQLARHHGLKADPARTSDVASILRVAGTFNLKDRSNPREVKVLRDGLETGTGAFLKLIDDAVIRGGIEVALPPKLDDVTTLLGSNTERTFDGPPVSIEALLRSCRQVKRLAELRGNVSEPEWTFGIINLVRFVEDGRKYVHHMSSGYHAYSAEEVNKKLDRQEAYRDSQTGKPLGPTTCRHLAEVSDVGTEGCTGCPFANQVRSPLGAARRNDPAPPPVFQELIGGTVVATEIPKPPKPFMRNKDGSISIFAKNAEGEDVNNVIYEYDLFPVRRLSNPSQGIEQQVWHVTLPREEAKDFTLDADMLYDPRKFVAAIANQGIYPNKGHVASLQEYMVAYISQLQKLVDADAQCNHLGWSDEYTRFILPDKVIYTDGTIKQAQLSLGALRASLQVHNKGDINKQIQLLNFYNRPEYVANQFFILNSLAAPIFHLTGHHGVIVNASGDAGSSKSTTLYAAGSIWGHPELYALNGTNNGATVRGRNERVTVFANLPVCVDEITHMPVKDAIDLAMSITQPGHRIRLQQDGVERASIGSYKATIMLSTGNNSLHGMLSTDNAAGTAGSMRVFEIQFTPTMVHKKHEADDFLHQLKENYGWLGEVFITYVIQNLEAVRERVRQVTREIDIEVNIQSSERFWSADIASALVAGEIAVKLGLLSFDIAMIRQWALYVQVPHMRGVVAEEYSDPLAIIADYLETINSNILVMEKVPHSGGNLSNIHRRPMGALLAHYNTDEKVLCVLKKGFKDHCARIGANSIKVIDDLHVPRDGARIITARHIRRTLGAGTEFAKAQSWCFTINMTHPAVSGAVDLKVLTSGSIGGGQGGSKGAAGLQLVT